MELRTYLILFICILGFSAEADAQYRTKYKRNGSKFDIRYGLKLGYQLSNFTGDEFLSEINSDNLAVSPEVDYTSLGSYHIGAYIDIRLQELLIFQPEVHFAVLGSEMIREADLDNPENNFIAGPASAPARTIDVPIQRRLSTIQIPLVAKIGINRSTYINVGPVVSFKVDETNVYGDIPDSLVQILQFTNPAAPDRFVSLTYGGLVGLSYQLQNGVNFALRYNRNFTNINKNEGLALLSEEPKNGTSVISFTLGYTFLYDQRLKQNIGRRH